MEEKILNNTTPYGKIRASHECFCQPQKIKSLDITTYKSVYSNKAKIGS